MAFFCGRLHCTAFISTLEYHVVDDGAVFASQPGLPRDARIRNSVRLVHPLSSSAAPSNSGVSLILNAHAAEEQISCWNPS